MTRTLKKNQELPKEIGYTTPLQEILVNSAEFGRHHLTTEILPRIGPLNIRTIGELLELNTQKTHGDDNIENILKPYIGVNGLTHVEQRLGLYDLKIDQTYEEQTGSKEEICTLGQAADQLKKPARLVKTEIDTDDPVQIGDKILAGGLVYHLGSSSLAREFSRRIQVVIAGNMEALDQAHNNYMPSMVRSADIPYGVFVPYGIIDKCREIDKLLEEFADKVSKQNKSSVLRK